MLVLCYHKIDCVEHDWTGIVTTPETFKWQLNYLKNNYNICDVKFFPKNPSKEDVLITFDDGYADNYVNAFPILEKLEIPAIFFISTAHMNTDMEDWPNELTWLILEGHDYPEEFHLDGYSFKTRTQDQRLGMHKSIERLLINSSTKERNIILGSLRKWARFSLGEKRTAYKMLSEEQLQTMSHSPFSEIGAHTVNHPSLGSLSLEDQRYEIAKSKQVIEHAINQRVKHFAYPFGGINSYSAETINILQEEGYDMAFSTTYKRKLKRQSPFEIPRVCINECTHQEFVRKLKEYQVKESYWWNE